MKQLIGLMPTKINREVIVPAVTNIKIDGRNVTVTYNTGKELKGEVVVDGLWFTRPGKQPRCHLAASSIELLHIIAKEIGCRSHYFQNKRGRNQPHYDISEEQFNYARKVKIECIGKEIIDFLKKHYKE